MEIAILIYPRFAALDAVGPYEVLSRIPGAKVTFVAEQAAPQRTDTTQLAILADATIEQLPRPDIVLVPGGPGQTALMEDGPVHEWLRAAHETSTWTASVCTGSLVLAAAGLLDGKRATSNWQAIEQLRALGADAVEEERVVFDGKIVTSAGVTAGIDMALAARSPHRRRPAGAGDPAGDRVRPSAAVRRGLARKGACRDRGGCAGSLPLRTSRLSDARAGCFRSLDAPCARGGHRVFREPSGADR